MKLLTLFFVNIFIYSLAYKATVFDFTSYIRTYPEETLLENTKDIVSKIDNSGTQDILVFPEYGITSYEIFGKDNFVEYAISVPEVNNNTLCYDNVVHKILRDISCSAKSRKTYTVINVLESADGKLYNTNIVFGRDGEIIAKYRKINLFGKEIGLMTAGKDLVTFKTDFDVTFGIFTCYDILFENPAITILKNGEVNDVIFPTAWFSQLPYLHSLSVQDGYQASTRVNLLASNNNSPQNSSGGSGIYSREKITTTISSTRGTKSVSIDVQRANNDKSLCFERRPTMARGIITKPNITSYITTNDIEEHINNYKFAALPRDKTVHTQNLCTDDERVCCTFETTIEKPFTDDDPKYMFSVYSDGTATACALISCTGSQSNSCGFRSANVQNVTFTKISIKTTSININHFAIPTTLNYDLEPLTYKYCETDDQITINSDDRLKGLITFGIYSTSNASSIHISLFVTIFISIITTIIKH